MRTGTHLALTRSIEVRLTHSVIVLKPRFGEQDETVLIDRFLSLACDLSGARSVRLRIVYQDGGEAIRLLDRSGEAVCTDSPIIDRSGQIEFPEMVVSGVAERVARQQGDGILSMQTGLPDDRMIRREPARHAGELQERTAEENGARWTAAASIDPLVRIVHERFLCEDRVSEWTVRGRGGDGLLSFSRKSGSLRMHVWLEFDTKGCGLMQRRFTALEIVLGLLEILHHDLSTAYDERSIEEDPAGEFDPPLVGMSAAVRLLRKQVGLLSHSNITVLVDGESGTGKEIVARNLHRLGSRAGGPLVIANCMEIPHTLLQSELFGAVKGSFTGATRDRSGLIENAGGGTFFLDEIGEMPPSLQAALLRVLQEKEIRRIGESRRRRVDVRFVLATNRDLADQVKKGRFREDLYYRISGIRLHLPPLRRRRGDIVPLARYFLEKAERQSGRSSPRISVEAMQHLLSYRWPGNVRELRNELERVVAVHPGIKVMRPEMLSRHISEAEPRGTSGSVAGDGTLPEAIERLERRMIGRALDYFEGNRTRAAATLGITRQGLLKKLKRYGMIDGCSP